jgi:hypothetical protein
MKHSSKVVNFARAFSISILTALTPFAAASDKLLINGFLTLAVGANLTGEREETLSGNSRVDCPCSITDWSNAGIYEDSEASFKPDSKIGLQAKYFITDWASFTAQAVSRGEDLSPDIEWAFFTFNIGDNWQVTLGRKRIPLYYYSDFQDVGFSYPWISPPDELYGWDATNYNGISVAYNGNIGDINYGVSLFGGGEDIDDNDFVETFSEDPADTEWEDLIGFDIQLSKDWWTFRFVYVQTSTITDYFTIDFVAEDDQQTIGLAFNGEFDDWFFLTELVQNLSEDKNSDFELRAPAFSLGIGTYFAEDWTLFTSYNQYAEHANQSYDFPYRFSTMSFVVRYHLSDSSSIKIQFDAQNDFGFEFAGDAGLMRVAYDLVF